MHLQSTKEHGTLGVGPDSDNMRRKRAHVILPEDLLAEVDRLVGERGRSAFLAEVVQREIQRRHLLTALREARGSWKPKIIPNWKRALRHFWDACAKRTRNDRKPGLIIHAGAPAWYLFLY